MFTQKHILSKLVPRALRARLGSSTPQTSTTTQLYKCKAIRCLLEVKNDDNDLDILRWVGREASPQAPPSCLLLPVPHYSGPHHGPSIAFTTISFFITSTTAIRVLSVS
eukprot:7421622-Pyramimonas_sp.AAC.1